MGLGSRWSGGLVERYGARLPLIVGPSITAAGYTLLAFSGEEPSYWTGLFPGLAIIGIGMTLSVAPLTAAVLDSAPEVNSGTASGINNTQSRGGGCFAVAEHRWRTVGSPPACGGGPFRAA